MERKTEYIFFEFLCLSSYSEILIQGATEMANSKNNSVDEDRDLVDFAVRIWNKTMSEPYYVFHFLLFFSYIPIRCAASNVISPSRASLLLRRVIIHDFCIFVFCIWRLDLEFDCQSLFCLLDRKYKRWLRIVY